MLHEVKFPSTNGRDEVTGWIYVPAAQPEGIVQLIHGFGEHSRRYFHLIVALMDAGFIVAANDHVGHGATAIANGTCACAYCSTDGGTDGGTLAILTDDGSESGTDGGACSGSDKGSLAGVGHVTAAGEDHGRAHEAQNDFFHNVAIN